VVGTNQCGSILIDSLLRLLQQQRGVAPDAQILNSAPRLTIPGQPIGNSGSSQCLFILSERVLSQSRASSRKPRSRNTVNAKAVVHLPVLFAESRVPGPRCHCPHNMGLVSIIMVRSAASLERERGNDHDEPGFWAFSHVVLTSCHDFISQEPFGLAHLILSYSNSLALQIFVSSSRLGRPLTLLFRRDAAVSGRSHTILLRRSRHRETK
jgi:hypothetical protein